MSACVGPVCDVLVVEVSEAFERLDAVPRAGRHRSGGGLGPTPVGADGNAEPR